MAHTVCYTVLIVNLFLQDIGKGKLGLPQGMLYPHIMLPSVVTLEPDGRSAKGRWRVFAMRGNYGGRVSWQAEFTKTNMSLKMESGKSRQWILIMSGRLITKAAGRMPQRLLILLRMQ